LEAANQFVRFDEGGSETTDPTTPVSSIRPVSLRLLYLVHQPAEGALEAGSPGFASCWYNIGASFQSRR
jgi:hypothetical protein